MTPAARAAIVELGLGQYGLCLALLGDRLAAEDAVHLAVRDVAARVAGGTLPGAAAADLRRACLRRCRRPGRRLQTPIGEAGMTAQGPATRTARPDLGARAARIEADRLAGPVTEAARPDLAALAARIEADLLARPPRPVRGLPGPGTPAGLAATLTAGLLALTFAGGLAATLSPAAVALPGSLPQAVDAAPARDAAERVQLQPRRSVFGCPGPGLGPPRAGAGLIWLALPCDPEALVAFDWSGRAVAALPVAELLAVPAAAGGVLSVDPGDGSLGIGQAAVVQSPDGRYLMVGGTLLDTAGADRLALPGNPLQPSAVWGDDSRHLCGLRNDSVFDGGQASYLYLALPGIEGSVADLLTLGHPVTTPASDVVACSPGPGGTGRALVQRRGAEGVTALVSVDLTAARTVLTRPHSGDQVAFVVASHDGSLIAENSGGPNVQGPLRAAEIVSLPAERELRGLPGVDVRGFSWDGGLAVTSRVGIPDQTQVVEWRGGTVVWTSGDGRLLYRVLSQPGGGALALAVAPAIPPIIPGCPLPCAQPVLPEILIVHPDGGFTRLAQMASPAW